jgi:xylulokinase
MPSYIISVDLGTTGTKAALFDLKGRLIADAYEETRLIYPKPGLVEQDPEDFYTSTMNTIKQIMAKSRVDPREVKALAFDSQMAGVMGIDSHWRPATHYDSWLDSRCRGYVEMIRSNYENLVIEKVGAPPSISHGPKILWWMHERPTAFKRVSKFIMPNCYVAGRMAQFKGSDDAFIDYTFLHFTGFADAKKGEWSQELCDLFKVPIEKFPRIVKPWDIIGELSEREAGRCGLTAGTPIVAGAGDTAANAFGAGIVEPGMVFDSAGTASVFACCVDEYVPDVENKTFIFPRSVVPGLWTPLAYIGGGGLCLRWFRDELAQHEKSLAEAEGINPYELLDRLAEKAPIGSEEPHIHPPFRGQNIPLQR